MTKKQPKTFRGKSLRLGGGGRSARIASKIVKNYEKKGMSAKKAEKIAGAVVGMIGRRKYGTKLMTKMSILGRKRKK